MAETHVISALVAKRAELAGELMAVEKRIVQIRTDLANIDGAIRVFDPSIAAAKIRPVLRRKAPLPLPRGQGSRIIMDVLRKAGVPLTLREISERIASDYRLDTGTTAMNKLVNKVRNTLARQSGNVVISELAGNARVWRIA